MSLLDFNWENQQNALSALTDKLNHALNQAGWRRKEKREWERERGWIVDGVYLSVREAPSWEFDPHLITYLPYRPPVTEEPYLIFAQTNVARFVGHKDAFIKLPKHSLSIARFVRKTLEEIEQSLAWFEEFANPTQCLVAADRIFKPGCPAHKWATEYLRSLNHERV